MNGISLKELRWFSTNNDEFCESEAVSIWQAVLFILPHVNDDDSVSYFEDIQRMEVEVYEDLIKKLDKEGQPLLRDDTSPNYAHSYTEWDGRGNLLLSEEQIDEILPELNRSRMLVIEHIEEADKIYQVLKSEIRKSRDKRPTKIELIEDTLRDDLERVLIKRGSLFAVFKDLMNQKLTTWRDIIIVFDFRNLSKLIIQFKTDREVLKEGTLGEFGLKGVNRTKPNRECKILQSFNESGEAEYSKLKHGRSVRREMTYIRNLLRKHTGLSGDPFEKKQTNQNHKPKFKVIIMNKKYM
jgi:hypothetical protein